MKRDNPRPFYFAIYLLSIIIIPLFILRVASDEGPAWAIPIGIFVLVYALIVGIRVFPYRGKAFYEDVLGKTIEKRYRIVSSCVLGALGLFIILKGLFFPNIVFKSPLLPEPRELAILMCTLGIGNAFFTIVYMPLGEKNSNTFFCERTANIFQRILAVVYILMCLGFIIFAIMGRLD